MVESILPSINKSKKELFSYPTNDKIIEDSNDLLIEDP